jgi:hypothetical protein
MGLPGLIFVRPSLDTTHASGRELDIPSFGGVVTAERPTLLRLRHAARNQVPQPVPEPEPQLEPLDSPALRGAPQ